MDFVYCTEASDNNNNKSLIPVGEVDYMDHTIPFGWVKDWSTRHKGKTWTLIFQSSICFYHKINLSNSHSIRCRCSGFWTQGASLPHIRACLPQLTIHLSWNQNSSKCTIWNSISNLSIRLVVTKNPTRSLESVKMKNSKNVDNF